MPKVSLVIPAYNIESYIRRCIESVKHQTFTDFEAIVVDDASTDNTHAVLVEAIGDDTRFRLIRHEKNRGLHLARRSAAALVSGEYVFCLDGDDELAPDFLQQVVGRMDEHPVDMLHVGITVIPENGVTPQEAEGFAAYINRPTTPLNDADILRMIYDEANGQPLDWRATQRLYRASLFKAAFERMTDEVLERAEDAYEVFVLATLSETADGFEACRGYIYHYGIGVTGTSKISMDTFGRFCKQFAACIQKTEEFVQEHGATAELQSAYCGMVHKLLELLANDWLVRVDPAEQEEALKPFAAAFNDAVVARELYRFVRDIAYEAIASEKELPQDSDAHRFYAYAHAFTAEMGAEDGVAMARAAHMKDVADEHMQYLARRAMEERYERQPIRILVTSHKDVDVPDALLLQPIQVGPGQKHEHTRFTNMLHDDMGENISEKNPMYCEMTTQYWAWKNIHDAEYVGFAHYRRYFNFTDTVYKENPFGEVMDTFIDKDTIKKYGLDDESIRKCIEGYDLITTGVKDIRKFPGDADTPLEQYHAAPLLHPRDIDTIASLVVEKHPEYAEDVHTFLHGHEQCFCNMYIMRKPIFDAYASWVFPLIDEWCSRHDMTQYSKEALRTPGHLTERLFNIWRLHMLRTEGRDWKVKELQCIHFTNPEKIQKFKPYCERQIGVSRKRVVPVVFAADNNYAPILSVAIDSMLKNADPTRFYDVVVLNTDIGHNKQSILMRYFSRYKNVQVTFYNVSRMVRDYKLDTNNAHISVETYFRFLAQDILSAYDKVVYLDSDLVVNGDVAELFDVDLGNNLVAATRDIDYLANLNVRGGDRMRYSLEILNMDDPYAYFQAGVMVFNTRELRRLHSIVEWLQIATNPVYIYNDQDILNQECQGRVTYLPAAWNVTHNIFGRADELYPQAPAAVYDAYLAGRNNPHVVHFAGAIKPWQNASCDMAQYFWQYARDTPFYEAIVQDMTPGARKDADVTEVFHERALSDSSPLRKIIDPLAPYGSARREALKAVGRTLRRRK